MKKIAEQIIEAHGGLDQWRKFSSVHAHLKQAGALWGLKTRGGVLDDTSVTVSTQRQWASHAPFGTQLARSEFTGAAISLLDHAGNRVATSDRPRELFVGHTLETPWDALQLAFFAGCAMWTYLNTPFSLAWDGVTCEEEGEWSENGESWQKLRVVYPDSLEVFSKVQAIYVGSDYLVRRLDYDVEIAGNTAGAHYVSDYTIVSGIRIPTKRRIYPRMPDGHSLPEPLVVSIDLDDIQLS